MVGRVGNGTFVDCRLVERTRSRLVYTLFGGVALGRIAFIMAITVGTLAAAELTGSDRWVGLPSAVTTAGTAIGATSFGIVAQRLGRRPAFAGGYLVSAAGAVTAGLALWQGSFSVLLVGSLLVGLGQSISHLARYAAADLRKPAGRAAAISFIVWAGTIGSVIGPTLLDPLGDLALDRSWPELAGPYVGAAALFGVAVLLFFAGLRPEPLSVSVDADSPAPVHRPSSGHLLRTETVRFALLAMVIGQVVMVAVMTVTPVHIRNAGQALTAIGVVITAHTLGMFGLAPVTGWLVGRFGPRRMIGAGALLLLVSCAGSALASGDDTALLVVSLFGLGLGWNMGFVAGSAHLIEGLGLQERLSIQGLADTVVWVSAGVASLSSGIVVEATSYTTASVFGAVLALVPLAAVISRRGAPAGHLAP